MSKALKLVRKLKSDEEGAALSEYTVLLGILVVAVIATIGAVGTWVGGQWTALNASLPDEVNNIPGPGDLAFRRLEFKLQATGRPDVESVGIGSQAEQGRRRRGADRVHGPARYPGGGGHCDDRCGWHLGQR